MTYAPNIPMEALRALLVIAGWYVLFYLHHRPPSKLRRIVLLVSFPVCYIAWRLISVGTTTGNEIRWAIIIFLFALLCGNLRESLFTAIYYIGMEACLDNIRNFTARYFIGGITPRYSPVYNMAFIVLYLVILGWAVFYYTVLKKRRGRLPLRFWLMMVVPPFGSTVLLLFFAATARPLQNDLGINIYLTGVLFGLFLVAMNLLTFALYVRLRTIYESHLRAQILQGQMDAYARQIKSIETAHARTQAVRHEMKNLLLVLQSALTEQNYDEARKRLRAVLGELDAGTVKPYTGITVIDAMLGYKAERLQAAGAALTVHAPPLDIPGEAAYDIAAMLAIMLDNAADAATSAAASKAGTLPFAIKCDIRQKEHTVLITFTNPLSAPLRYRNGEIVSAKPERGHGLGLPSLRSLAEKYAGDIKITGAGGVFTITVLLFVPGAEFL
jgi:hypothetical protein